MGQQGHGAENTAQKRSTEGIGWKEGLRAGVRQLEREGRMTRAAGHDATMVVSIQSYEGRVPVGSFVSFSCSQTYSFCGLDQMLLAMDDIMESVSMPQAKESPYEGRDMAGLASPGRKSLGGTPYWFQELDQSRCPGEAGVPPRLPCGKISFLLRFHRRQNWSMQGELAIPTREGSRKVAFRSALELMRLLYECLDTELGTPRKLAASQES